MRTVFNALQLENLVDIGRIQVLENVDVFKVVGVLGFRLQSEGGMNRVIEKNKVSELFPEQKRREPLTVP